MLAVIVSAWTPFREPEIARRRFGQPGDLAVAPLPIPTALLVWLERRALGGYDPDALPFAGAVGPFFMSHTGVSVSP